MKHSTEGQELTTETIASKVTPIAHAVADDMCHDPLYVAEAIDRDSEEFADMCWECGEHFILCRCNDEDIVTTTSITISARKDFDDDEIPF